MKAPRDAAFAIACGLEARRLRSVSEKPSRATLKEQRSRARLAAQHVRGLLDSASDETLRIGASLALAALESCADITDIVEARELLAAARGEVA